MPAEQVVSPEVVIDYFSGEAGLLKYFQDVHGAIESKVPIYAARGFLGHPEGLPKILIGADSKAVRHTADANAVAWTMETGDSVAVEFVPEEETVEAALEFLTGVYTHARAALTTETTTIIDQMLDWGEN